MRLNNSKWVEYTIADVACEINEKTLNPSVYNKFIRPEDLDIGAFYINKYREPEDVKSGRFCYNGDILFTRRSVSVSQFKRRSSIIRFDAVCSDEITVIRQNKVIYPELLNLILNTSNLWDYAISFSVGSVSKRIKWEDLAKYTFKVPKKIDEQKYIVELFQTLEDIIEQVERQENNIHNLQKQLTNGLVQKQPVFGNLLKNKQNKLITVGKIAECDKKYPEHNNIVDRFIGLEHIEPYNFQTQGWGNVTDGTTFTKRFSEGDILFGKRRAYLRKVAIADFDGICSNDILVIRAKHKMILQDLLSFYIASDVFINHAISTSAGSLSPRTKWKDLAEIELSIPDLETQEEILAIFKSTQETLMQLKQQKAGLRVLKQKLLNDILG